MGYQLSSVWCFIGLFVIFSVTSGETVTWVERPKSVSAREGEDVIFKCRLSTNAKVVWAANNKDGLGQDLFIYGERWITDERYKVNNDSDLIIESVTKSDNRVYACKTKDAGIQTATLTVLLFPGPPIVTPDTTNQIYMEGQQVRFTCSSTGGNPSPRIVWMKNGNISNAPTENKPAAEVGGTASSSIAIKMDKSDHQANYSCLLYNDLNVDNKLIKSIILSVQYSPSIGFRPYSTYIVKKGEQIQFFCDVDANPAVSAVSWTKDSAPIAGSSPTRSIASVGVSDQGNYTCKAENNIGESSGTLQLEVQYAPILKVPPTKTVDEGDEVSILCDIEANPRPYEIQWAKVGSPGQSQNDQTLSIPSASRDSAGNYSCKAISQLRLSGEGVKFVSTETFTYLNVRYKPGRASISGSDEVDVGERLEITCTATPAGYPEASYTWTKDGETLTQTGQTYVKTSATLDENGRYSCTPSNSKGSGQPASVDVRVYEPPTIVQSPTLELHVQLSDKDPLSLRCGAQGYPEPQVTWYQDGYSQDLGRLPELFTVVENRKTQGDHSIRVESILEFRGSSRDEVSSSQKTHLKIRDMGNYTCKAETNKHTDTPTAGTQLLINFPPVLEQTSTRYAVSRLEKLSLQCQAQAHPAPAFQWFFQGQRVSSNPGEVKVTQTTPSSNGGVSYMKSVLTIEKILDENYGLYKCMAINALGNSSVEIEVTTKSRPEKATDLRVASKTWESVHLSWKAGFDGGYSQRFYINQSLMVVPLSARSFNVTQLLPSTTYTFRVFAANQLGHGPASDPVVVKTNDLQIPSLPEIPVFNSKELKLLVTSPEGNLYCLRVIVKAGGKWNPINGCMKVVGDTLEINRSGIRAINVSVCLSHRTDVCGLPLAADIHSSDKEPTLTEDHVIIIACVCAVIIITLLIILVCFCVRRKRYIAKGSSQGANQGDPPPYQAVPPNKKPVSHHHNHHQQQHPGGYDNQDGPLELYEKGYNPWGPVRATTATTPTAPRPSSSSSSATTATAAGEPVSAALSPSSRIQTLADIHFQFTTGKTTPTDPPLYPALYQNEAALSDSSSNKYSNKSNSSSGNKRFRLDLNNSPSGPSPRHSYYNTNDDFASAAAVASSPTTPTTTRSPSGLHRGVGYVNLKTYNNRMDGYPNRDMSPQGVAISGPLPVHSPSKDKYIDLQDRGGGGDFVDKGGYPDDQTAAGGKPKKKLKWRWYWRKKETPPPAPPPFSHNPPGHNCGLPCCNQTAEVEIKPISNQRGCVVVPIVAPAELSESNFVMKKVHRPSNLPFGKFPVASQSQDSVSNIYTPASYYSTPDGGIEDDVSDEEYEEDTLGRRLIKLEHRSNVMAPEPSAELIAMHGLEAVGDSTTLLRRRNKPLAEWEQIKHRHFAMPDAPQTPCRIMFLNHQPGESTDYYSTQDRDSGYLSPGQTNALMNTLKKYETLANEQEKLRNDESNNLSTVSNNDNVSHSSDNEKKDLSDTKSVISEGNISMFSKDGQDRRGSKARILETSLPPVPKEEPSIRDSFRSSCETNEPIEEDNESLVDYGDHIYDVVNDVKAASEKLAQAQKVEKIDEKEEEEEKEVKAEKVENKTLTKVKSSVSDLLAGSDSEKETESVNYHASVSDYNTESYIYNGSLLSQKRSDTPANGNNDIYYQGSLLRHRFVAEHSNKPIIFMMGGKPIVIKKSNDTDSQQYYNTGSQQSEMSCSSSEQRIVPKIQLDYHMRRRLSLIDSHGEDFINSPSNVNMDRLGGGRYSGGLALSGLNIESSTKLKLWDLRLITINREENNYSTYPPRRPASEDLCIGSFSRSPKLGYRHRHNSDVSTDKYVGQKIQRILRSPVLTRTMGVANFASVVDNFDFSKELAQKTWDLEEERKLSSYGNNLTPLDIEKDRSKSGRFNYYPSLFDADEESLLYESPSFSGIYRLSQLNRSSESEGCNESSGISVLSSGGGRGKNGGGKGDGSKSGSRVVDVDDGRSSIYGGSIYGSTFGWNGVGEYNNSKRNSMKDGIYNNGSDNNRDEKKKAKNISNEVVWGDASFVDWRRQANLFKDRHFITMIL